MQNALILSVLVLTTAPSLADKKMWTVDAQEEWEKAYIYYDFPNGQDPHFVIDSDLTDGLAGQEMGMAFTFKDLSNGSDCAIMRDLDEKFHLILEDWSPIDAPKHGWDSPLAMHAVSDDGIEDLKILAPPVDERTQPTGKFGEYSHRNWHADDPENYDGKPAPVNVPQHKIKQGDITAFGRHEIHERRLVHRLQHHWPIRMVRQYWPGNIIFAEGHFYIATQTPKGSGFQFEVRMTDTTANSPKQILDRIALSFTN